MSCVDGIKMPHHGRPCDDYFRVGNDSPTTPIASQFAYLLEPLSKHGGVDVFLFQQIDPHNSNSREDALLACKLYTNHDMFNAGTGNFAFCFYENEQSDPLYPFLESSATDIWYTYQYAYKLNRMKGLVHQLYGLYMGNKYAKQFSIHREYQYGYKIRLRPDTAFLSVTPMLVRSMFATNPNAPTSVQFANCEVFGSCSGGVEDTFNVGLADDMDHYFDRYVDLTEKEFIYAPFSEYKWWNPESWMIGLLKVRYNISVEMNNEFRVIVVRTKDWK
jgi:hypothetical protein